MDNQDESYFQKWQYYNHAVVPQCAPNENVGDVDAKKLFKQFGGVLIRYTSDFDCNENTNWWHLIKDTKFDINLLKSKRRYEIKKGERNFRVEKISADKYIDELYNVQVKAYQAYPKNHRPTSTKESFSELVNTVFCASGASVYAAFSRESNEMCGYAYILRRGDWLYLCVLKTDPSYESYGVNAAIVYQILLDYNIEKDVVPSLCICDGERNILHQTAFQEYLMKYFDFRKAYCKLHIIYRRRYKPIIKIAYRLRKILHKLDRIGIVHKLNGILKMEEIVRSKASK